MLRDRATDCRGMSESVCSERGETLQRRRDCTFSIGAYHTVRSADAFTKAFYSERSHSPQCLVRSEISTEVKDRGLKMEERNLKPEKRNE